MKYRIEYEGRAGVCRVTDVKINVDVVLNLPQWSFAHQADSDVRDYYACVKDTVTVHERRHGSIARETGEELDRRFWAELTGIDCRDRNARAREIFDDVMRRGRNRQAEFDRVDYARNRYQRCDKQQPIARAGQRRWSMRDSTSGTRVVRSGQVRNTRASSPSPQQSRPSSSQAQRNAELQRAFQQSQDGPREPAASGVNAEPVAEWSMGSFAQSALGLFTLLGAVIGLAVWRVGRQRKTGTDDFQAALNQKPAWLDHAIQAAEAVPADGVDRNIDADRTSPEITEGETKPSVPKTKSSRSKTTAPAFGRRGKR